MSLYNDCIDLAYGCMTQLPRSAPEAKIKDGPKSAIWAWLLALPAWLKVGAGIGLCLLILVPVLYFALRGKPTVLVIYGEGIHDVVPETVFGGELGPGFFSRIIFPQAVAFSADPEVTCGVGGEGYGEAAVCFYVPAQGGYQFCGGGGVGKGGGEEREEQEAEGYKDGSRSNEGIHSSAVGSFRGVQVQVTV